MALNSIHDRVRALRRRALTLSAGLALTLAVAPAGASAATHAWPFDTLQLGLTSAPGQAAAQRRAVPALGLRYQYLSGGVNTSDRWTTWGPQFVRRYIVESERAHIATVFSWYEIRPSEPGASASEDSASDLPNLRNRATMLTYFQLLREFYRQAAGASVPVILQVEPDLWGYIEQASRGQNGASVPVEVSATGMAELSGLPNNAVGLAKAFLRLRDRYAPRVLVAYHDSIWGSTLDIHDNNPSAAQVRWMAARSVRFYRSLHTSFDAVFTETTDRDTGYPTQLTPAGMSPWWRPVDFELLGRYIALVHRSLKLPVVIWQIPLGNTLRAAENNTPYHYRDNKVQSLLGSSVTARKLLRSYAADGVAALLFGGGQSSDTEANTDGGYFYAQARRYYRLGALPLG